MFTSGLNMPEMLSLVGKLELSPPRLHLPRKGSSRYWKCNLLEALEPAHIHIADRSHVLTRATWSSRAYNNCKFGGRCPATLYSDWTGCVAQSRRAGLWATAMSLKVVAVSRRSQPTTATSRTAALQLHIIRARLQFCDPREHHS